MDNWFDPLLRFLSTIRNADSELRDSSTVGESPFEASSRRKIGCVLWVISIPFLLAGIAYAVLVRFG